MKVYRAAETRKVLVRSQNNYVYNSIFDHQTIGKPQQTHQLTLFKVMDILNQGSSGLEIHHFAVQETEA